MMTRRVLIGGAWSVLSRLLGRTVDFVTLLVLARLLTPADFGVVAIAMTLVTILEAVFELPVGAVLLRQPDLTRADFDTAFTLATLRGLVLGAVALVLAGPFARIYGDPQLLGLIAVLSLAPIFRGLASPRMALFIKRLEFRNSFLVDVAGRGAACLFATAVAVVYRNHWAIVASTVAGAGTASLASYVLAPHRPRLSLARWSAFKHFFGWSSAAQLVSAMNWQCDRLLLGRLVPPAVLGQFSMASDLSVLPNQTLLAPLMVPTLSAFTRLNDDRPRLRDAYARFVSALLAVGLPMLVGLSLTARPLVALVLGGKWNDASPLLQWLALEGIPYLFIMPLWPLAMATGQVRLLFQRNVVEFAVKVPLLVVAALVFGIPGVVASRIIMAMIIAGVSMHLTRRLIGTSISWQVAAHWRPVVSCCAMASAVLAARGFLPTSASPAQQLVADVGSGVVSYAIAMIVLGFRPGQVIRNAAFMKPLSVAAE